MFNKTFFLALTAAALMAATPASAGCGDCGAKAKSHSHDIVQTAVDAGKFSTLVAAAKAGGLAEALKGDGPFTVFAPTDEAFAALPEGTVETLLKPENIGQLKAILTYHVVPGRIEAAQVIRTKGAETLNGQRVSFAVSGDTVQVAGARVVKADIACSNGVIHVIDRVILPEGRNCVEIASEAGTFKTLLAAAQAAGLADTLAKKGPFTIFAPSDDAFAKLPDGTIAELLKPENKDRLAQILAYHVVAGRVYADEAVKAGEAETLAKLSLAISVEDGQAFAGAARIVATDIQAKNGVIHVIDTVLLPPTQ